MGYRLNHLDEPIFMAVSKPLLIEFGIHHRLKSCAGFFNILDQNQARKNSTVQKTQGFFRPKLNEPAVILAFVL